VQSLDLQYLFILPIKIIKIMTKPLSQGIIQKIRNEVFTGKTKYKVAKELGIGKTTVYNYTVDIPGDNRGKPLSKKIIKRIREDVLKGKSKYQIAKEMGLSFNVVYFYTKALPNKTYKTAGIQGKCIDLLHELLEQGYVNSNQDNCVRLRKLKKFLPMIQRAQIEGKSVYYLNDKNKEALKAIIKRNTSRIITYQELSRVSQVFGVNLSIVEKNNLLNRKKQDEINLFNESLREKKEFW
jgi:predicted transcriptional regulator